MTEVAGGVESIEVLGMTDSIEQDRNSDDSIELNTSQTKSKHGSTCSSASITSNGQQKKRVTKKQSKEYLIQNLNNSQHEKINMVKSNHKQLKNSSRSDTTEETEESTSSKVAEDENNISSANEKSNLNDSIADLNAENQLDNTPNETELVSSVYSNSSSQSISNNQVLQQQQQRNNTKHPLPASPASPPSSNLKSASLKNSDKMSPGLAKRIQPSTKETLIDTCTDILYNNNNTNNDQQSTGSINGSIKGKQHSKSLVTSTCSSSSSTTNTATVTPASSQSTTSSSNSFHSATNSSSAINAKIQNALERNMEKLNINTQNAKNNMKLNNGQINTAMTREELELFSNGNLNTQQGYFSGDSLSSTPEHHNKKRANQNGQVQEFILNRQQNQDINEYEEYLLEHQTTNSTNQQQLSPSEQLAIIDHKQRMLNRTSAEREMTPDSINNDEDILEAVNSRQKNLKPKQPVQKKKIPLNQRPNGAPITNKAQTNPKAKPKSNGTPTSKVTVPTSNRQTISANKIPIKSTTSALRSNTNPATRVATQTKPVISSRGNVAGKQSMPTTSQTRKQQQQQQQQQRIADTTNKKLSKVTATRQQQKPPVDHKGVVNSKVMPVVEEGLSNDELNDVEEDEVEEEEEENVPNLIEYQDDDQEGGQEEEEEEEDVNQFYNENYEEEELEEKDEGDEQFVDEEEYENENENEDEEEYEYEQEEDDDYETEENEEHVEQMKVKQVKPKVRPAPTKNFVNQIQASITASRKYKKCPTSSNGSVNNVNSKKSPVMQNQSNRIARKCAKDYDTDEETNNLLAVESNTTCSSSSHINQRYQYEEQDGAELEPEQIQMDLKDEAANQEEKNREINVRQIMDPDNQVLIEGVLFRARYLGSTQLITDGNPTKLTRMLQAQEAVGRIKAPDGESQPGTDVDLFVSTEKIMVLNTDLEVEKLEIMMDHSLRSISYIADIGNLVVLMAKRRSVASVEEQCGIKPKQVKMICHVFESDEAQIVAQSIGQAFQVAYMEYLKANGIEDMSIMKDLDYQEVLNQQEIMGDELGMFAKKECQKEVIIPKAKNEMLGVVIVESGWGSMLPTVVVANMMPTGPAARCGNLNIGDQIISLNGISMVGLPLAACQTQIKTAKTLTLVRLVVVPCPPVVEVLIKRPDTKYQLGFSVQDGIICSLLRGGIAERGGVRVGHRIIEINNQSVVATSHEKIVNNLANSVGELRMKTMPTQMFRLLTGQEQPNYI